MISVVLLLIINVVNSSVISIKSSSEISAMLDGTNDAVMRFLRTPSGDDNCAIEGLAFEAASLAFDSATERKLIARFLLFAEIEVQANSEFLLEEKHQRLDFSFLTAPPPVAYNTLPDSNDCGWIVTFHAYQPKKKDRSCILPPDTVARQKEKEEIERQQAPLKFEIYDGPSRNAENIVDFVDHQFGLHVQVDGTLSELGKWKDTAAENFWEIPDGDDIECARLDEMPTAEEFWREYVVPQKPVIFGAGVAQQGWKTSNWINEEWLRANYGDKRIHVKVTPTGEFEGCEEASLWEDYSSQPLPDYVLNQLQSPHLVVVRPAEAMLQLDELLTILNDKPYNASFYLEYTDMRSYLPGLHQDVSVPVFANWLNLALSNVWLGDGNTLGKLHFDPYDNLLSMISGSKTVYLFHPHNNENLYEGHIREATLQFSRRTGRFRRKGLKDSTSMVMSPVDIQNVDYEAYPLFKNAKGLQCTINKGETLYMPAFWWHEVQSKPDDETHKNMAVNFWFDPFYNKDFPCAECRLALNPKYDSTFWRFNYFGRKRQRE